MFLLLLAGCVNFPYFYDREFYLASLLRWEDNDHDGFREVDGDCDDAEATVSPDIEETCNDRDDNCDEEIDNNALDAQAWFQDNDADGFGNTDVAYVGCDDPTGFSLVDGDCDDTNANVHPEAEEPCGDAKDVDCDGLTGDHDGDGDGFPACDDCLDTNAAVNRDAVEVCNGGIDDNCDDEADGADALGAVEWFLDADNDNHGAGEPIVQCLAPSNYATVNDDCDDTNPEIWPGTTEICDNGQDDNCDGETNGCRTGGLMVVEGRLTAPGGSDLGAGLSGIPDVTGDGHDDMLVGAWDPDGLPGGAVYITAGPTGDEAVERKAIAVLTVESSSDIRVAAPVGVLGDVDVDGLDEWAIAGLEGEYATDTYGVIYVVPERNTDADIGEVATAEIWETAGGTGFGYQFTVPGDVNGDGASDLFTGAPLDAGSGDNSGAAYLFTTIEGVRSEQDAAWVVRGARASSLGTDMATGDFNGDGVVDVAVGAPGASSDAGALYTFFGPLTGEVSFMASDAKIDGDATSLFGLVATSAGDADGDGLQDVWCVAAFSDLGAQDAGALYLLTDLSRSGSAATLHSGIVSAEAELSYLGFRRSAIQASDLDGDEHPDVLVSASGYDDAGNTNSGKVYLLYGPLPNGMTSVSSADAWHVGTTESAAAGATLIIPGDLDGDGNLDIAVQEYGELGGANDRVNILYGYSW